MNEEQIKNIEIKLENIQADVKKMKSYFLWTFWVTIALLVLPMVGLLIAVPKFLNSYSSFEIPKNENIDINNITQLLNEL